MLVVCGLSALPATVHARSSPETILQAGRAALEDGLLDLAQKKFEDYIDRSRRRDNKALGVVYLAEALFRQSKYQEVIDLIEARSELGHGTAHEGGMVFWSANAHYELGLLESARARLVDFETRFSRDVYLAPALRLRIRCMLGANETEEALKAYADFDKLEVDDQARSENLLDWAGTLIDIGRPDEAEQILTRLVDTYGESASAQTARVWLGRMSLESRDWATAKARFSAVTENEAAADKLRAEAWSGMAAAYESETNLAAAAVALGQAAPLLTDPDRRRQTVLSRGLLLVRDGETEAGLDMFRTAVVAITNKARAAAGQLELAQLLLEREKYKLAESAFQHYLEAFTAERGYADAQLGKGWSLWGQQRYAEAATAFEKAHALHPDESVKEEALFKAADALFANEQFSMARELYTQVLAEFPDGKLAGRAQFQMAECMGRMGEKEEAEAAFEELATRNGSGPIAEESVFRKALLSEDQQEWEDAIGAYDEILERFPDSGRFPEALLRRGLCLYQLGRFREALSDFERVTDDFTESDVMERAFYMRGWCHYLLGNNATALSICAEFVERFPKSAWAADVLFWLGEYYYNRGDYEKAELHFAALSRDHPDAPLAPDALYWAGRSAAAQKEYLRAIEHYTTLSKTQPPASLMAETRFAQGDALSELGEFSRAILAFEELIEEAPNSYLVDRSWGRMGDCQFTLGTENPDRYERALECYRRILSNPDASVDLVMQAEYKMGRCEEKSGETDEAFEHYMNVVYRYFTELENGRRVSSLWFTRAGFSAAALMEAAGEWERAVSIYTRVADAGVPAASDATARIQKIKIEHWLPFLKENAP